jgi:hypothetical protein
VEDLERSYRSGERSAVLSLYQISIKLFGIIRHFVHFLSRGRKRTKRKRPCYAALRAALCFSNRAVAVELANAQTATAPFHSILRCSARHKGGLGQNQKTIKSPSRGLPEASRFAGGVITVLLLLRQLNTQWLSFPRRRGSRKMLDTGSSPV